MSDSGGKRLFLRVGLFILGASCLIGGGWYGYEWWSVAGSRRGDTRVVISPWVEHVRLRQDDAVMFEATAPPETIWRTATLDEIDSGIWKISDSFDPITDGRGSLVTNANAAVDSSGSTTASVEVRELASIWLPLPATPASIDAAKIGAQWNRESGTVTVRPERSALMPGDTFTVTLAPPKWTNIGPIISPTAAGFDPSTNPFPRSVDPTSREATAQLANHVRQPDSSELEQMEALVIHLTQNFTIDASMDAASLDDQQSLPQFLSDQGGSRLDAITVFVLSARQLGVPARVGVGFQSTEVDPSAETTESVQRIYGSDSTAWPEVHIDGIGWVAVQLN